MVLQRVGNNLVTELQYVILHLKNTLLQNIFTSISLSLSVLKKLYIKTTMAPLGEGNGTPLQYSCLEKSHGWRSLVGCSPWGHQESDTTERLHFHFSLSCTGEGNGSPLQYSCLENPKDGRAWWAAVYGVTQSRTQLKWLSNSNSNNPFTRYCDKYFNAFVHVISNL